MSEEAIQHYDLILQRGYFQIICSGGPLLAQDGELGHHPVLTEDHETILPNNDF